jgi:hypothetical protein
MLQVVEHLDGEYQHMQFSAQSGGRLLFAGGDFGDSSLVPEVWVFG